jgi:hypothetical protein
MIMKKLLLIAALTALCSVSYAQSTGIRIMKFMPLLSGYNVAVPTNATPGLGIVNTLFTMYNGQIVYSLTNNVVNGTLNTNTTAPDAFKIVDLVADANGDVNANAALVVYIGNTNWIPVVVTNSFGQYFVTNWTLATSKTPNWMYPGTTNVYPVYDQASTNPITISLYRALAINPQGGLGADLSPTLSVTNTMWETTPSFTCVVTGLGINPVCLITNLPTVFLQGARHVKATVNTPANSSQNGTLLLNQLGIMQPQ